MLALIVMVLIVALVIIFTFGVTKFGPGVHFFVCEWRNRWVLAWSYEERCLYFWHYCRRNPQKVKWWS